MTNILRHKGYSALIEFDAEDAIFFGRIAGIRDGIGFHADNVADLTKAFEDSVEDYLDHCRSIGKAPQKPYSGRMMLRVDPTVHRAASMAAELSGESLNAWSERALAEAARPFVPEGETG